jgi:hypothetical protein
LTLGGQRLRAELNADGLLSLISSEGVGFSYPRTATAVDPGVMVSARLGWSLDQLLVWLQLGGVGWLRSEKVQVFTGPSPVYSAPIPPFEFLAIFGVSFIPMF